MAGTAQRKMLLLTGGLLGVFTSKMATSLVRYCRDEVVGVVDSKHAGGPLDVVIGCGEGVPIFADVEEALAAAQRETGLPATDVVRFGARPVFDAVRKVYNAISH